MHSKILFSFFNVVLIFFFLGCGEENDNTTIDTERPTNLSTFRSIRFVGEGDGSGFVNFTGATSGSMTRQPFLTFVNGVDVTAVIGGTFSYTPRGNINADLLFFSNSITFGGLLDDPALETTLTINEAPNFIDDPIVLIDEYSLEFAESPLGSSNVGSFELIRTFTTGATDRLTGTFQFSSIDVFNDNDINTGQ